MSLTEFDSKRERLLDLLRGLGSCAVAFSAGVDSSVVAKAAFLALGDAAVAVTGVSPSLAAGELDEARRTARAIGIRHQLIDTEEFSSEFYTRNDPDRCYHCKSELYTRIGELAPRLGVAAIVNGANLDDLGDFRPGLQAGQEHAVRSPLAECGFTKQDVRELARQWDLPTWDKPASPCLSSRIAYGEEVTPEKLTRIEQAESYLRGLGLREFRVRYHPGDLARIEVPVAWLPRLGADDARPALVEAFRKLGFRFVTVDWEGFRSGSLNTLVPADAIKQLVPLAETVQRSGP